MKFYQSLMNYQNLIHIFIFSVISYLLNRNVLDLMGYFLAIPFYFLI